MAVSGTILEGNYLKDIFEQPKVLEATLNELHATPALDSLLVRLNQGEFKRVILTGMGASFLALYPLNIQLVSRGLTSFMLDTSELLYYQSELLRPDTLLVVNSQSGSSAEIAHLLELNKNKAPVIGVSNTAGSPLDSLADAAILTRAGREFSTSCKTYVTGLLALTWLGGLIQGHNPEQIKRKLDLAAPAVHAYLLNWKEYTLELSQQLKGVRNLYFAGRGASLAAAGMAGLVMKEAAHFQAEGMGSAAFRHGPLEICYPRPLWWFLPAIPKLPRQMAAWSQRSSGLAVRQSWSRVIRPVTSITCRPHRKKSARSWRFCRYRCSAWRWQLWPGVRRVCSTEVGK